MRKSNANWGLETPLSLIGYFSKLHKQHVLVTNERICNNICGGRQFGLNSAFRHSGSGGSTRDSAVQETLSNWHYQHQFKSEGIWLQTLLHHQRAPWRALRAYRKWDKSNDRKQRQRQTVVVTTRRPSAVSRQSSNAEDIISDHPRPDLLHLSDT